VRHSAPRAVPPRRRAWAAAAAEEVRTREEGSDVRSTEALRIREGHQPSGCCGREGAYREARGGARDHLVEHAATRTARSTLAGRPRRPSTSIEAPRRHRRPRHQRGRGCGAARLAEGVKYGDARRRQIDDLATQRHRRAERRAGLRYSPLMICRALPPPRLPLEALLVLPLRGPLHALEVADHVLRARGVAAYRLVPLRRRYPDRHGTAHVGHAREGLARHIGSFAHGPQWRGRRCIWAELAHPFHLRVVALLNPRHLRSVRRVSRPSRWWCRRLMRASALMSEHGRWDVVRRRLY